MGNDVRPQVRNLLYELNESDAIGEPQRKSDKAEMEDLMKRLFKVTSNGYISKALQYIKAFPWNTGTAWSDNLLRRAAYFDMKIYELVQLLKAVAKARKSLFPYDESFDKDENFIKFLRNVDFCNNNGFVGKPEQNQKFMRYIVLVELTDEKFESTTRRGGSSDLFEISSIAEGPEASKYTTESVSEDCKVAAETDTVSGRMEIKDKAAATALKKICQLFGQRYEIKENKTTSKPEIKYQPEPWKSLLNLLRNRHTHNLPLLLLNDLPAMIDVFLNYPFKSDSECEACKTFLQKTTTTDSRIDNEWSKTLEGMKLSLRNLENEVRKKATFAEKKEFMDDEFDKHLAQDCVKAMCLFLHCLDHYLDELETLCDKIRRQIKESKIDYKFLLRNDVVKFEP